MCIILSFIQRISKFVNCVFNPFLLCGWLYISITNFFHFSKTNYLLLFHSNPTKTGTPIVNYKKTFMHATCIMQSKTCFRTSSLIVHPQITETATLRTKKHLQILIHLIFSKSLKNKANQMLQRGLRQIEKAWKMHCCLLFLL